ADGYQPNVLPSQRDLLHAESVHLWIGIGLSNQLLLLWTVRYFELIGADLSKLAVVQFSRVPGTRVLATDLGILDVNEMQRHPQPQPLAQQDIKDFRDTWNAITSAEPARLLAALRKKRPRFARLQQALKALIARYPDEQTGLSHWDSELLKSTKKY